MRKQWTLAGQGSEKWFGNGAQVFADTKEDLKENFRDCVEGDWSNSCHDADGEPESKSAAIARIWEEFENLAKCVEVE